MSGATPSGERRRACPRVRVRYAETDQMGVVYYANYLIWFEIDPECGSARDLQQQLRQQGVLVHASGSRLLRACTHLDVTAAQIEQAAEAIRRTAPKLASMQR